MSEVIPHLYSNIFAENSHVLHVFEKHFYLSDFLPPSDIADAATGGVL